MHAPSSDLGVSLVERGEKVNRVGVPPAKSDARHGEPVGRRPLRVELDGGEDLENPIHLVDGREDVDVDIDGAARRSDVRQRQRTAEGMGHKCGGERLVDLEDESDEAHGSPMGHHRVDRCPAHDAARRR